MCAWKIFAKSANNMNLQSYHDRLRELGIDPFQIIETFVHSGGAGGQNVNKVSTCVVLRDPVSGLLVKMQVYRTQAQNREAAWKRLIELIEERRRKIKAERVSEREQARRRNRPRPRKMKRKMLEGKRRRSQTKQMRRRPED